MTNLSRIGPTTPLILQNEGYVVEIVRGEVCFIDFSEALANPEYAIEALETAHAAAAPDVTITDLRAIITEQRERGVGPWAELSIDEASALADRIDL